MGTPAFEVAREVGNNLAAGFKESREKSVIDSILSESLASGDPQVLQQSIGKILSQVSPERQDAALQFLQSRLQYADKNQKEQRQRTVLQDEGINPDLPPSIQTLKYKGQGEQKNLKLNESLNQVEKRYKTRINALKTPFEKRDAFGSIFLDFDQDEKKRKDVLTKLDKELDVYTNELKRTYEKYGEKVPDDIENQIKDSIMVSVGGQQMSLRLNEQIDGFEKQYPAKKYKDKKATDDEGNQFISDGIRWKLME